jgi:hypothetical protein
MKKIIFLFVLVILSPWLSAQDIFQESLFSADMILGNKESIKLNLKQEERIKALHNENQGLFSAKKKAHQQATEELKNMLQAQKFEEKKMQTQMDKVLALENELKKLQFQHLIALRSVLSEEQIQGLKNIRENNIKLPTQKKELTTLNIVNKGIDFPPAYFLDQEGEMIRLYDISSIDPNNIESIEVLKGEKAIKQFGSDGRNGVIIMKLRSPLKVK